MIVYRFAAMTLLGAALALSASCSSEKPTTICGPGASAPIAAKEPKTPLKPGPRRLGIDGSKLVDEAGDPIELHGANLKGIDDAGAADLVENLGMNFVRLRIDFEPEYRDDKDPSGLTSDYRTAIDGWIRALVGKRIWILIEMRSNDELTNDPAFYDPKGADFAKYRATWIYLAKTYGQTDYIAGYGLLAEPSASRGDPEPVDTLTSFQLALMDAITTEAGDTITPFFVGPDFNYDTMQYRYDDYFALLAPYHGRLVYEVNGLVPKPWIQDGSLPSGVSSKQGVWPQLPAPTDFGFLLEVAPGEDFVAPQDNERIFNKRREEPENFPRMMNEDFLRWYLGFAHDFAVKHSVPMVVDQFGASTNCEGQLAYEQAMINVAEDYGFHWSRWSYNAGSPDRFMAADPSVCDLYRQIGRRNL